VSLLHPFTALAIPLVGAVAIALLRRFPNAREAATLLTAAMLLSCVGAVAPGAFDGPAERHVLWSVVPGVDLALRLEPLGIVYALVASSLWVLNSLYSIGYMRGNREQHQTRFYVCFALALASTMGIAFSANLFTMFVFYEALTLSTFPLVAHKGTPATLRSARTYLGILVSTSVGLLLPAIIGIWIVTGGEIEFVAGGVLPDDVEAWKVGTLFVLAIYGIGKAALMPVHRWLPAAMVAPTPVSALLHAVAVVKAGVFALTKVVVYTFGVGRMAELEVGAWLLPAACFTVLCASGIALYQDNLKRRLAYSTVSQLSYVILAVALFTPWGIAAAAMHIAAHAFGKITLFFAAGSIYTAAHRTEVSQLDGIGRRMPWTMAAFTIGSLSMIGLPPTAGFVSKWFLLGGAWQAGSTLAVATIVVSTLLNAGYFLPIVWRAFFRPPPDDDHPHGEAPWPIVVALSGTAALTVLYFVFADVPAGLASSLVWYGTPTTVVAP